MWLRKTIDFKGLFEHADSAKERSKELVPEGKRLCRRADTLLSRPGPVAA